MEYKSILSPSILAADFGNLARDIRTIDEAGAEYVDCMNAGIEMSIFDNLGFVKADYSKTIVPEHFNPLEHKNVPLEYAFSEEDTIVIFKGDGDQDRPNSIKELCKRS